MLVYHEAMKVGLRTGAELGQDGENPRCNVQLHLLHSLRAKPTQHRFFFIPHLAMKANEKSSNFILAP